MTDQKYTEQDLHKALFMNLVMMLASSAMQQMGKIVNPMTNKTEMNMEGAQLTIDMLLMLQKKSTGNLDDEEKRLMDQTITSLQLTYVETSKGQDNQPSPGAKAEEKKNPSPEASTDKKENNTKYHKSYGE